MKLATTTEDFNRYCDTYEERIQHIKEAGFSYIDLSFYDIERSKQLLLDENWVDNARKIKEYAENLGMEFVQSHSPSGNPFRSQADYDTLVEQNIQCIKICSMLGIPNMVVHPGWKQEWTKEEWQRNNKDFFDKLLVVAKEYNVNVLHENTATANMPWYFPKTGADMRDFSEFVNNPNFHSCWDTGHGNIEGSQYDEIMTIGDDLYALHINDNRGTCDEHLVPFMGTVNMSEIMNALKDSGYKGVFTFESGSTLREAQSWLGNRHEFKRDERLLNSTLKMQKIIEKFMHEVGEHILTTYGEYEG